MRSRLERLPLERAVQVCLALTVVAFVCGSASVPKIVDIGRPARWLALGALLGLALLLTLTRRDHVRLPAPVFLASGVFLALAAASALWSVRPRLTLERTASLALLLVTAALIAHLAAGRPRFARGVLGAIVAGAAAAAAAGLVVLAVNHGEAVIPASTQYPARYEGLGGNPNTVSMLLAVALPLAAVFLASAKSPRERAAVGVLLLFFLGSIVASASRAALAAGCGALLVLGVLGLDRPRSRVAAAAAVVLVFAISVLITQIPQARREQSSSPPRAAGLTSAVGRPRLLNAELYRRLEDDVGHPPYGSNEVHIRRTLFGSSGRAQAWDGALQQALDRPVAGYGFGTEQHVFVDRYISFEGGVPENSYLGLLLQLGFAGLAAFLVIPAVLFVGLRASLPRLDNEARTLAAACAAVVAGALVIAFAQSYVYSVGNVATASVWICAFLLPAVAVRRV